MTVTFQSWEVPWALEIQVTHRRDYVFLKIEGALQAICNMHHLAFPLPLVHQARIWFFYGGQRERALSLSALSTLLLLTYEDAMGAGE